MKQLNRIRPRRRLCWFAAAFLLLLTGIKMTAAGGKAAPPPELLAQITGTEVTAEGRVEQEAISRGKRIYYLKEVRFMPENTSESSSFKRIEFQKNDRLICDMEETPGGVGIGSRVVIKGTFVPFANAENEGQFDAAAYYGMSGFCGRLRKCEVLRAAGGTWRGILSRQLFAWKMSMRLFLYENMEADDASVLAAMLLGDRADMDAEIKSLYVKSGIAHILAISGLHISLIGMTLYRLLRRTYLPPSVCSAVSVVVVLLYGQMTGGSASVTRAVTMFVLCQLAELLSRSYDLLTGLALSMLIVLIRNPFDLSGAGFLLSFSAVLGLALLLPLTEGEGQEKGLPGSLFERMVTAPLRVSLCVSAATMPVLLWFYHVLTPYSVLLNLLVIPIFSVLLMTALFGVILRMPLLLLIAGKLLHVIDALCSLFRRLPLSLVVTGRPAVWQIVFYYLALFFVVLSGYRERDRRKREGRRRPSALRRKILAALVICAGLTVLLLPARRIDGLDFLSVGQGDCIVLRTREGGCVIVDCGSSSERAVGTYRLIPYLKYNGLSRVDAVIVSHAHEDHTSGVFELLESGREEGITISCVLLGETAKRDSGDEPGEDTAQGAGQENTGKERDAVLGGGEESGEKARDIAQTARENGCEVRYIAEGDRICIGSLWLDVLYECSGKLITDENDASVVLLARWSGLSALLTGDSSQMTDQYVLDRLARLSVGAVTCLKVAHHGSSSATSEALLSQLRPQIAVISCGKNNRYGHPHRETLEKLSAANIRVFRTDISGQIAVREGKKGSVLVGRFR